MAGGCNSLLLGRRGDFDKCFYWVRDENNEDLSQYEHKKEPDGIFWAEEITAEEKRKLIVGSGFMFDENLITIRTKGQISLKEGDIVNFEGEDWIVKNCQQRKYSKTQQFMNTPQKISYIQLKR